MPAPKNSIFNSKEVIAANKKYTIAFWVTLASVTATAIFAILSVATVFSNDPNAQIVVMFAGIFVMVLILLVGALAMDSANNERISATNQVFDKLRRELITKYIPRS